MGMRIREIMNPRPVCIDGDITAREAIETASHHRIHHLPILDEQGEVIGIVCTCDLRDVRLDALASSAMKTRYVKVSPDDTPLAAAELMRTKCISSVLVFDVDGLCGIVTKEDLLNADIEDRRVTDSIECCRCLYCGARKHLRRHGKSDYACVTCLDRAERPELYDTGLGG